MKNYTIKEILEKGKTIALQEVTVQGWVRAFRSNRFIALNDGSTIKNIQIVVDFESFDEELLKKISTAASLKVRGEIVESQGAGQEIEVIAKTIEILGEANPDEIQATILQPKQHSLEKLREQAHLRFRTNTFAAIMRVRNSLMFAIHQYFNEQGFVYVNTPIITGSDAEGAGEMFSVTSLDMDNLPKDEEGKVDYSKDFFGKHTNLTVSGQLNGEVAAMGLGKIYTFGPTFRAENSNTTRHLAEFWMIEPEMAFYNLDMNMDLAEDLLKYVIRYALKNCPDDMQFLAERFDKEQTQKPANERSELSLMDRLDYVLNNQFIRLTYTEAIDILMKSKHNQKGKFQYPVEGWGTDLQSEHERYLVEKHFKTPVILFDYPAEIKAFYMRLNEDGKTVRAMDILFPGIGEIVGGSQREERLDVLDQKIEQFGIHAEDMWWYRDTRRFGTVPHSGFGLGLERLVLFVTGMGNIRDVIPFPRTPKNAEF
ncbi:asparagine--tRNA ligase [Moheibacter stercoris]|uniref:Asparagine--tRNA ligase n=1 Tax=Moheibacter stercoris TaxID=1628251 RepID=A0ABV2LW28_9FLAO